MKTSGKIKRLMAYILTPLIFMIIGYAIAAFIFSPFIDIIHAAGSLVISRDGPDFSGLEFESVFDEDAADVIEEDGVIHISEIEMPVYGQHYAEIRNRRIGLEAPVHFGDSYEILRFGVGHNFWTDLPGFGGMTLLAGHNTTHFLPFQDIVIGDVIELQTNYGHFEYEVTTIELIHHVDDAEVAFELGESEIEMLIMYTCYPFDAIGLTPYRLFVYAEKISGPVVDMSLDEWGLDERDDPEERDPEE
jgi:sortase A